MKVRVTAIAEGPQGPIIGDQPPESNGFLVSIIRVGPQPTSLGSATQLHVDDVDGLEVKGEYNLTFGPVE